MASTRLAEAVGYPGSSVAFAQLLSGMERDGLIVREVRGKRTYRITLPEGVAAQAIKAAGLAGLARVAGADGVTGALPAGLSSGAGLANAGLADAARFGNANLATGVTAIGGAPTSAPASAPAGGGFDYDELARRLLVQVLRKLASASVASATPAASADGVAAVDVAGAVAERAATEEPAADGAVAGSPVSEGTADGLASGSAGGPAGGADRAELMAGQLVGELVQRESEAERAAREKTAALEETVAGLERELATAWTRHGSLTAENARLREQLSQAQRDLVRERTRRAPLAGELNHAEVVVLERLLDAPDEAAPALDDVPALDAQPLDDRMDGS
jgi:hypothetical protein